MKLSKLLLAVVSAAVLFGALASSASARSFRITPTNQRATFRNVEVAGGFGTFRCDVTLEGTLHSETIAKVLETLVGYITRAEVSSRCAAGSATILTETLPWHVRYGGFTSTEGLPRINTIFTRTIGYSFRIREPFGLTCLSRSSVAEPLFNIYRREVGGVLTEVELSGEIRFGAECASARVRYSGRSTTLTTRGSTTRITVTLI